MAQNGLKTQNRSY